MHKSFSAVSRERGGARRATRVVRAVIAAAALAVTVGTLDGHLSAQQAGQNVNVLPVITTPNGNVVPDPLRSDYYLQRQVEPTIAASTRNPNHVLALYDDYRAVDIPNDSDIGESSATHSNPSLIGLSAKLFRRPFRSAPRVAPSGAAASSAWSSSSAATRSGSAR